MRFLSFIILNGLFFMTILSTQNLRGQSNPKVDRPIQQCIYENSSDIEILDKNFSIAFWLGRMVETSDRLAASSGTGGGPQVIALLKMEEELDELLMLSEKGCENLAQADIKALMQEMKSIFQEKQEVKVYKRESSGGNIFDDEDEVKTYSLTRDAARKIKKNAAKMRKTLVKM